MHFLLIKKYRHIVYVAINWKMSFQIIHNSKKIRNIKIILRLQ